MCLVQIKQAQIKFPLSGFWTVLIAVKSENGSNVQMQKSYQKKEHFFPFIFRKRTRRVSLFSQDYSGAYKKIKLLVQS
jgi:hypothetical protein